MTCPACDCELSVERESCENCGAPTYLATARQPSELTHCTACGTRGQAGNGFCFTCGGKKSFPAHERAAGLCRNCGGAWGTAWRYCQLCGVARENGLVEMIMPSSPLPVVTVSVGSQHRHSFNAAEAFVPESAEWQDASFPAYFMHDGEDSENEAVRHQRKEREAGSTSFLAPPPVRQTTAGPATATTSAPPAPGSQNFATPHVQAANVGHKSRVGLKRPLTKHYITIILVLVGVILLFSALKVSGIRPEDLFGRLWPS